MASRRAVAWSVSALAAREQEVRVGLDVAAADAALELVELRQAEALAVLDDERVGVRVVDAALDDGGRHEHVDRARRERLHHTLELVLGHLPVRHADARLGHGLAHPLDRVVDRLDAVVDVVDLAAARKFVADRAGDDVVVVLARAPHGKRLGGGVSMTLMSRTPESDICSVRGMGVAVSVSTSTCSRSSFICSLCCTPKRCSSSMTTSPRSFGATSRPEQAVRADEDVDLALRKPSSAACLLGFGAEARQHLDAHRIRANRSENVVKCCWARMVVGAEHHDLLAVLRRLERRADGDLGLAVADVAADEAVHRLGRSMSALTSAMAVSWSGVSSYGERVLQLVLPRRVRREREAVTPRGARTGRRGRRRASCAAFRALPVALDQSAVLRRVTRGRSPARRT